MNRPTLVVLGGLPATGKSTVASHLNKGGEFSYLRIDTIEQALRASGEMGDLGVRASGYMVGYAVAGDLLDGGNDVLAECVNPFKISREAWREVANSRDAGLLEVELFCSDQAEHHRRAESRGATVPGLKLPSWEAIRNREYEPWGDANLRFDTCVASPEEVAEQIRKSVDNLAGGPSESPRGNTPRRQSGGRPQSC